MLLRGAARFPRVLQSTMHHQSRAAAASATAAAASAAAAPDAAADHNAATDAPAPAQGSSHIIAERLGLIGAGQMASALARALIERGCIGKGAVCASDHSTALARSAGIETLFADAAAGGAELVASASDILLLGVKPQGIPEVLAALKPHVDPRRHLVVSIAAGVTLSAYESALPLKTRVVRVMPNTPLMVGAGASAYALGTHATPEDERRVRSLLEPGGLVIKVPESLLDAVTALSGSGPAFVYVLIEALADAGVAAGLSRDASLALAAQTTLGAAKMVLESSGTGKGGSAGGGGGFLLSSLTHPAVLKDRVCSPAGTTIAGLQVLEAAGMRSALMRAVAAAAVRAGELSAPAAAMAAAPAAAAAAAPLAAPKGSSSRAGGGAWGSSGGRRRRF